MVYFSTLVTHWSLYIPSNYYDITGFCSTKVIDGLLMRFDFISVSNGNYQFHNQLKFAASDFHLVTKSKKGRCFDSVVPKVTEEEQCYFKMFGHL